MSGPKLFADINQVTKEPQKNYENLHNTPFS